MDALLTDRDVLARFDLEGLQPDHVQVRLPSDLTGPSATYSYVIRHPRSRSSGQSAWRDTDLQHHGQQTVDELNYIMESRPEKGLFVFMHEAATSETGRSARGWQKLSERIQIERELGIPSYSPSCDRPEQLPLTSRDATDQFVASIHRASIGNENLTTHPDITAPTRIIKRRVIAGKHDVFKSRICCDFNVFSCAVTRTRLEFNDDSTEIWIDE
jgi:hypothetical protein